MTRWDFVKVYVAQRRKALVALVVSAVVAVAARYGVDLDVAEATLLTSLLTAVSVYWVPNSGGDV